MSIINHTPLNPNGYQLMKYTHDKDVRFILMYGGSSSGKSFGAAEVFIMLTFEDGENSVVFRKVGATIKDSIYEDFKVASDTLGVKEQLRFLQNSIRFPNGARIDFKGLDESERIKGISNYKRVLLEELSEFEENDFKQIRKRLRGKEGQQIIGDWNPISEEHWIKKKVIDKEDWHDVPMTVELMDKDGRLRPLKPWRTEVKSIKMNSSRDIVNVRTGEITTIPPNMVLIQTTYLNNFWVVGSPNGKFGFYDEQAVADFEHDKVHDPDYYRIYALGEWGVLHTGSEFFWAYNTSKHLKQVPFIPELPVHLCVDNNVLPYITNTLWQVEETPEKMHVRQFAEVMATSPDNTVKKAARLVAKRLRSLNYADKVFLHGDASTRAANTIDEEKRSFLDLYISTLNEEGFEVEDCVGSSNPSVPMTGEFINQLLDGADSEVEIEIDESCKVSSDDYLVVQKDVNGGILKTRVKNKITGQTYEEHGHACFIASTPISTSRGIIPISEVKIGDFVDTEKGLFRVYNSFVSALNSRYFFVTLKGNRMGVTYDHPVYTSAGFKPVCELREGDEIIILKGKELCKEKLSCITASSLIDTLSQNLRVIGRTLGDGLGLTERCERSISTATCGRLLMEKFLKATMFIMLMAITTTTQLATLLLCLASSMCRIMAKTALRKLRQSARMLCVTQVKKLLSGIAQRREERGTLKTRRSRCSEGSTRSILASIVARPLQAVLFKVRSFARTIASRHGEEASTSTMRSALVNFAELNFLSTGTLIRSAVLCRVPLSLGGRADVYNISTESGTFFANNVLVHNCDTFRYLCYDVLRSKYIEFANRRKRNIYAKDDALSFFNGETEYKYSASLAYVMPNVGGVFVMVHGSLVGREWHIVNVFFRESVSTEEITHAVMEEDVDYCVFECADAYFGYVRDLRKRTSRNIKVMGEVSDVDRRIAATSDFVKEHVRFSPGMRNEAEYDAFLTNMLDYNPKQEGKQASAAISGFAQYVMTKYPMG